LKSNTVYFNIFLVTKPEESSSQDKPASCNTVKTEINGSTNHEFSNGEYLYSDFGCENIKLWMRRAE
jgi:hypothetical protein